MDYHHIEIKTNSTLSPPEKTFLGSTIRGALGYFLKDQVCFFVSTNSKNDEYCKRCPYPEQCLYDHFYSKNRNTNLPKNIRIDVPLYADTFDFGIYLFEDGSLSLRQLLTALRKMLYTPTLTYHKYAFTQSNIFLNGKKIDFHESGTPVLSPKSFIPKTFMLERPPSRPINIAIHLLSPCVIGYKKSELILEEPAKKKNSIKTEVTLEDIIGSVRFRKAYYETGERQVLVEYAIGYSKIISNIKPVNIKKMKEEDPIFGVMGTIEIHDIDPVSYGLLRYAEVLGVGKKTVIGAGKIKIEVLNEKIV